MISHFLSKLGNVWLVLLAILACLLIYWPGLHGGFFFDDYPNIIDNKELLLDDLSLASLKLAALSGVSGFFSRPVSQLSFALNQYLSGFDPFAFKLTNLVIHCLNSLLVYFLAMELFKGVQSSFRRTDVRLYAAVVSVIWLVHPIQLSSVLYVVQRMTSLSALFVLIAICLHTRARLSDSLGRHGIILLIMAWCVFWPLSILSKETGLLFPGFVMAYELIVRRSAMRGLDGIGRFTQSLLVVLVLLVPLYLFSPFGAWLFSGYEIRSFSLSERLMTEARIFWEYLRMIFFPGMEVFALYHDDIQLSKNLLNPWTTLPAIIGVLMVALIGFWARKKFPLVAFGIAWFLVGHSLESTFIPLELVHEHRNYLPLFGGCVAMVGGIDYLVDKPGVKRTLGVALIIGFIVYCMQLTALRSEMFRNDWIRTQVEAQHHPDSARTNYEAGRALAAVFDQDQSNLMAFALARKHFERANEFDRNYAMGFLGMLILDCVARLPIAAGFIDAFALRLSDAQFGPENLNVMKAISTMSVAGTLCLDRGYVEKLFDVALQNPKVSMDAKVRLHVWLADYLWLHSKDLAAAKNSIKQALLLQPMDTSNRFKWAQLVFISGDKDEARKLLSELQGQPLSPEEKKTFAELRNSLDTPGQ